MVITRFRWQTFLRNSSYSRLLVWWGKLFRRFIDDIIWITATETSNQRIPQTLTSALAQSGLELMLRQACKAEQTNEVEFLHVNHCISVEDDFGLVTSACKREVQMVHRTRTRTVARKLSIGKLYVCVWGGALHSCRGGLTFKFDNNSTNL